MSEQQEGVKKFFVQRAADEILLLDRFHESLYFVKQLESFFEYKDGHLILVEEHDFYKTILKYLEKMYERNIDKATIIKVFDLCMMKAEEAKTAFDSFNSPFVSTKSGLFDLSSGLFLPHTKEKLSLLHLPFTEEEMRTCDTPTLRHFLETSLVFEDAKDTPDLELVDFMQDVIGYYLIPGYLDKLAVAFFFVGNGANGKSVLADLVLDLVGGSLSSSMSVESLTTDKFSSSCLVGKLLNVCNEEESKHIRSDKFKAIITGESIQAERKFGASFRYKPMTKFLFCSNKMPGFEGINYGIKRRMKIIPFFKTFRPEEADQNLREKLRAEMPGIAWWALQGAHRLFTRGLRFVFPEVTKKTDEEFEMEASSVAEFLHEHYVISETAVTENKLIYELYVVWCKENGRKPFSSIGFHRECVRVDDTIKTMTTKKDGKTTKVKNITLKEGITMMDMLPTQTSRVEEF